MGQACGCGWAQPGGGSFSLEALIARSPQHPLTARPSSQQAYPFSPSDESEAPFRNMEAQNPVHR